MTAELERVLLSLLKGEHSSLRLTFNEGSGPNYMTVKEFVETSLAEGIDWVSEEEKNNAIQQNSMWELQWYPDTPVGSYHIAASSLSVLLEHLGE